MLLLALLGFVECYKLRTQQPNGIPKSCVGLVLLWAVGWLGWLLRAGSSSSLILNHLQALELEARGEVDVGGRVTVFAQAFRSLHFMVRA